ncbi:hypothetical protein GCG54_00015417 [Colletotrichum gloeosporioides]|uniref:Uncharacterized protein n=1 Tax=Colletotrichum gloeosporioides TaxID=474922 RepID=A0A8H4CL63_COLGL|nr:uncharacterized protein GCG54_00015417 [Colletotrichum gloeosporioides]KAF3805856.1 hypothetical protein GCG54_00015417 [Colletotrichum gloeosporioides]
MPLDARWAHQRILGEGLVRIVVDTDKTPASPLLHGDRVSLLVLRLPRDDSTTSTPPRFRICVAHLGPVLPKLCIATRPDAPIAKGQFAERPGGQMDQAASKRLLFWAQQQHRQHRSLVIAVV